VTDARQAAGVRRAGRQRAGVVPRAERGAALVITLLALFLLATLGVTLVVTATVETLLAGNHRDAVEGWHAAEAGLGRVLRDLRSVPEWSVLLGSPDAVVAAQPSTFVGATLVPVLRDGRRLDLRRVTHGLNCPQLAGRDDVSCTAAGMDAVTADRPWGANNPRWRLYAHGAVDDLLPGSVSSPFFVAVWVADDPSETDGDPSADGRPGVVDIDGDGSPDAMNPGRGVVQVRAESYGPGGARRAIEVTLARVDADEGEWGYTGQRGRDERNGQGSRSGVQGAGATLPRLEMGLDGGLAPGS
jgi:hypothetical protein